MFGYLFRPWKFEHMAIGFLSLLLRDDYPLPARAISFFTQCLNHDALVVRKVGACVIAYSEAPTAPERYVICLNFTTRLGAKLQS